MLDPPPFLGGPWKWTYATRGLTKKMNETVDIFCVENRILSRVPVHDGHFLAYLWDVAQYIIFSLAEQELEASLYEDTFWYYLAPVVIILVLVTCN